MLPARRGVFFENPQQLALRNKRSRIPDIDPESIRLGRGTLPALDHDWRDLTGVSPIKKEGIAPDFDCPAARREPAGVVEEVN